MKKRELKYQLAQLRERIEALEHQALPQQCEKCGVLFRHVARISWKITSGGTAFVNKPESLYYIDTPNICSRCKVEQQKESA